VPCQRSRKSTQTGRIAYSRKGYRTTASPPLLPPRPKAVGRTQPLWLGCPEELPQGGRSGSYRTPRGGRNSFPMHGRSGTLLMNRFGSPGQRGLPPCG
jgi:hypothetical protein